MVYSGTVEQASINTNQWYCRYCSLSKKSLVDMSSKEHIYQVSLSNGHPNKSTGKSKPMRWIVWAAEHHLLTIAMHLGFPESVGWSVQYRSQHWNTQISHSMGWRALLRQRSRTLEMDLHNLTFIYEIEIVNSRYSDKKSFWCMQQTQKTIHTTYWHTHAQTRMRTCTHTHNNNNNLHKRTGRHTHIPFFITKINGDHHFPQVTHITGHHLLISIVKKTVTTDCEATITTQGDKLHNISNAYMSTYVS